MNEKIEYSPFQIVTKGSEAEIIEKKSRFIASLYPVDSEEDAINFIEAMKKKYYDARHNCSAYIIGKDAKLVRCSDDGEPSQTAGRPMLDVLLTAKVCNVVVVVTRYFGGTLLGTGGLVRAYSLAVKEALALCEIATMRYSYKMKLETDYNGIGKIQYLLGKDNIPIESTDYTDIVCLQVCVPYEQIKKLEKELIEVTNGKIKLEKIEEGYFIDK